MTTYVRFLGVLCLCQFFDWVRKESELRSRISELSEHLKHAKAQNDCLQVEIRDERRSVATLQEETNKVCPWFYQRNNR